MALLKQKIELPFAQGLDTKTDEFQIALGRFEVLENVIFQTLKSIRKRAGYEPISLKLVSGEELSNLKKLSSFRDELLSYTNRTLNATSSSIDRWVEKGDVYTVLPRTKVIVQNNRQQAQQTSLHVGGVNVYAWVADTGGIYYSCIGAESGTFLVTEQLVTATGIRPRIAQIGDAAYILYIDGSDLKARKFNILTPATLEAEFTLANDVDAVNVYDVYSNQGKVLIAYENNSSILATFSFDQNITLSSVLTLGASAAQSVNITTDEQSRVVISFSDGTSVKYTIVNFLFSTTLLAPVTLETIANIKNVTHEALSQDTVYVYYEISDTDSKDYYVKFNTGSKTGTIGTPAILQRSVGLASKTISYDSRRYVLCLHESTLQNTYFLVENETNIVSKINPNSAGNHTEFGNLPQTSTITSETFLVSEQIKTRTVSQNNAFFSPLGVSATVLGFNQEDSYQDTILANTLHIAGGSMRMYDGARVVEHGFHLFPEDISDSGTATTGGSLSDGQRQYVAVYAWRDNNGFLHRSSPSLPITITLAGATATQTQDIDIPTLRLTDKEDVIIELYRTEADATLFYKVDDSSGNLIFNDKTVNSITFTDITSDADLIDNELLYIEGDVVENIAIPATTSAITLNNRIFASSAEDRNKVYYSKIRFDGAPVEFTDIFSFNVDPKGGDITALAVLDEKLIIFKETQIYYQVGQGPTNSGVQDDFSEPEQITSDLGCTEINSIVNTPNGLMFKSRKGIYMLDRTLQLRYIGAAVEKFNSLRITSAKIVPDTNQVRFTTEQDCLVYDYLVNQWSTFTNFNAFSSEVLGTEYYLLKTTDEVMQETPDVYMDAGTSIKMRVVTPWLSLAGVQAFQRIYQFNILGQYKSPHHLRVKTAFDFNPSYIDETTIDVSEFIDDTRYGNASPYGTDLYGTDENVYQMKIYPKQQKCQSFKISIDDMQNTTIGEGLSLSLLTMLVGAKQNLVKNSESKGFGTE